MLILFVPWKMSLKFINGHLRMMKFWFAWMKPANNTSKKHECHCQQDRVQIRTGQVLEGQDLVILVGVARNTGLSPIEFDERACATSQDEVLAVAAWPKVVLGPKEATELYVVVRRATESFAAIRPSLLDRSEP